MARGRRSKGAARPAPRPKPIPPGRGAVEARTRARTAWTCAGLFAASLAIRLLFGHATPDASWAYSATFKGDAALWLEYARAIRDGRPYELGLPIHPPGTAYLVAALWDGTAAAVPRLRLAWCAFGALTVVAVWLAVRRVFGDGVAAFAAGVTACSTALIVLSNSVNAEAPYLLLVVAALWLGEEIRARPRAVLLALWGLSNALACLLRVEHLLAFLLWSAWLIVRWRRSGAAPGALARSAVTLGLSFAIPLVPWHLHAWRSLARFNEGLPGDTAAAAARAEVEAATRSVAWEDAVIRRRDELPAFARSTATAFVAATVAHRGGHLVTAADFESLELAFGYTPRPLARFPFVSAYGPLNFALANHPLAEGGFSRAALEEAPPLSGGTQRYPPALVRGLPPADLSFTYPPHLRLVNEGYAVAGRWIAADPVRFLRLLGRKLSIFWSGATLGVTGFNFPLGPSGLRRAVDMVTPDAGAWTSAWRALVLVSAGLGAVAAFRQPAAWPWLLYLAARLPATLLFFGYARHGALVVPVVAMLVALAPARWPARDASRAPRARPWLAAALLLSLLVEGVRWQGQPGLRIDGWPITSADPLPGDVHRDQRVAFSW